MNSNVPSRPSRSSKRTLSTPKTPTLAKLKTKFKDPKQVTAVMILLAAVLGIVSFVSALTYTVQEGDTLTAIAVSMIQPLMSW